MLQHLQLNMKLSLTHLAVSIQNKEFAGFILKINKVSGCKKQTNKQTQKTRIKKE